MMVRQSSDQISVLVMTLASQRISVTTSGERNRRQERMMKNTKNLLNFNVNREIGFDPSRGLGFNPERNLGFNYNRRIGFNPERNLPFGKRGVMFRGYLCQDCGRYGHFSDEHERYFCGYCKTWIDTSQSKQKELHDRLKPNKKVKKKKVRGKVQRDDAVEAVIIEEDDFPDPMIQLRSEREDRRLGTKNVEFQAIKKMESDLEYNMKKIHKGDHKYDLNNMVRQQREMAQILILLKKEFIEKYGDTALMDMELGA